MPNGIKTGNFLTSSTIDTLLGNKTVDGVVQSRKIPVADMALQMLATSPMNALLSAGAFIPYSSKAAMDADLDHDARTIAWVIGDADPDNDGIYRKTGASGAGSWIFFTAVPVSAADLAALISTSIGWRPGLDIVDADGNRLISFYEDVIEHPQIDTFAEQLDGAPTYDTMVGWRVSVAITDTAGNRLIEIGEDLIDHPDTNDMRDRIGDAEADIVGLRTDVDALAPGDLATLFANVALLVSAASRNPNKIVLLGDSRLDQWLITTGRTTSHCFINWLNAMLGHPWEVVGDFAVSGQRSDQYLSDVNVAAALATKALWFFIFGLVNDFAVGAGSYFKNVVKPKCDEIIAKGGRPVICTEPGAQTMTSSAIRGSINQANQEARQYAADNKEVVLLDFAAWTLDPASAYMMRSGYCYDDPALNDHNTHFTTLAAAKQALNAYPIFEPIITRLDRLVGNVGDSYANGGIQIGNNPLFLTTTGGTLGSGVSGTAPGGTTITCTSGYLVVVSLVATEYGNRLKLEIDCNGVATGEVVVDMSMAAGDSSGDVFEASAQVEVQAGAVGLQAPMLNLISSRSSVVKFYRDFHSDALHGPMPDIGRPLTLRTLPLTIGAGTRDYFANQIRLPFCADGAATVYIDRPCVQKILSL